MTENTSTPKMPLNYSTLSVFSKQIFSIFQENSSKIIKLNNRILNLQKSLDEEDTKLNTIVTQLESMIKNIRVIASGNNIPYVPENDKRHIKRYRQRYRAAYFG